MLKDDQDPPPAWAPDLSQKPLIGKDPLVNALSPPSDTPPVYNVLLLGPTQAGKSTFLESVKQYADSSYDINIKRIGNGNMSHTQDVIEDEVMTSLPIYKLYDMNDDGRELDTTQIKTESAFKKLLARDDDLELRAEELPGSKLVRFRIIDTPGLDDTNGNDVQHIARIFSALGMVDTINLVIIMDPQINPLTLSQKAAYQDYFDLFTELKALISVVHTRVPNHHRYPGINKKLDEKLKERAQFFKSIKGQVVPTMRIDCDVDETAPAQQCMTRNAIREILEMATIKAPLRMDTTYVRKTRMMTTVDGRVHPKFINKLEFILESESDQLASKIAETNNEIEIRKRLIRQRDTDDLEQLFEHRVKEEIEFFGWVGDTFFRPIAVHAMKLSLQEYTIKNVDVNQQSMMTLESCGGINSKYWEVQFKRARWGSGYYHAVVCTTSRIKYHVNIEKAKLEIDSYEKTKQALNTKMDSLQIVPPPRIEGSSEESVSPPRTEDSSEENVSSNEWKQKMSKIGSYHKILELTRAAKLPVNDFLKLANAGVYQGSDVICQATALEKYLMEEFGL